MSEHLIFQDSSELVSACPYIPSCSTTTTTGSLPAVLLFFFFFFLHLQLPFHFQRQQNTTSVMTAVRQRLVTRIIKLLLLAAVSELVKYGVEGTRLLKVVGETILLAGVVELVLVADSDFDF